MVTSMRKPYIIFGAVVLLLLLVFSSAFAVFAPEESKVSNDVGTDAMSRPSGIKPGNGQDFRPVW